MSRLLFALFNILFADRNPFIRVLGRQCWRQSAETDWRYQKAPKKKTKTTFVASGKPISYVFELVSDTIECDWPQAFTCISFSCRFQIHHLQTFVSISFLNFSVCVQKQFSIFPFSSPFVFSLPFFPCFGSFSLSCAFEFYSTFIVAHSLVSGCQSFCFNRLKKNSITPVATANRARTIRSNWAIMQLTKWCCVCENENVEKEIKRKTMTTLTANEWERKT